LHVVWLSYYCRPAAGLKQKTHRRAGGGLIDSRERSKPSRRAGQQRVGKQQVQVAIHSGRIVHLFCLVTGKIVE
jgi:hypothetical protein